MARAPFPPQQPKPPFVGPERKTSTFKQWSGMNSQDERYGVEKDEFFYLENIMRVADGRLHSVSGPTDVLATFPTGEGDGALLLEPGLPSFLLLEGGENNKLLLE